MKSNTTGKNMKVRRDSPTIIDPRFNCIRLTRGTVNINMHSKDKQKIIARYIERAERYGHGAAAIGEPKERQAFYYYFMLDADGFDTSDSILDVGCGYGDLLDYLILTDWRGRYCGIDINPVLIDAGRVLRPNADLRVHDIQEESLGETFDWCFSCHVITSDTEAMPYLEHLEAMLTRMWGHARKGVLLNLLSPLADYTNPIHARPSFADVLAIVAKFTNRFALRHDYMPYEFTLQLHKNNEINRDNLVFSAHNVLFDDIHGRWKAGIAK